MTNDLNYQLFRIQAEAEFEQILEGKSQDFKDGVETGIEFLYQYIKARHAAVSKDLEELGKGIKPDA